MISEGLQYPDSLRFWGRDPRLQSERMQGFAADPVYVKGEVFVYVGLPQNLKDLKDDGILHTFNWIDSPIRFLPKLSFIFSAYFVCAHLRGASFGTRLSGGKWTDHSPGDGTG